MVHDTVPDEKQKVSDWSKRIQRQISNLEKSSPAFKSDRPDPNAVSGAIVRQCKQIWTLPFSRFYQVVPVSRDAQFLTGGVGKIIYVAVNWSGVYFIDEGEKLLLAVRFMEIKHIELMRNVRDVPIGCVLETVQGKSFHFNCLTCGDVYDLISTFLEGLKARSRFVVSLKKIEKHQVDSGFLTFNKGDLLILDDIAGQEIVNNPSFLSYRI